MSVFDCVCVLQYLCMNIIMYRKSMVDMLEYVYEYDHAHESDCRHVCMNVRTHVCMSVYL